MAAGWLIAAGAGAHAQAQTDTETAVTLATEAMRTTFGPGAEVTLSQPVLSMAGEAVTVARAVPEPSSRTAGPVRFVLYGGAAPQERRVGRLTARVDVVATHVRARHKVEARRVLTIDDVEVVRSDIGRQALALLPPVESVTGSMARKALQVGEVMTPVVLMAPALVTSGEEVSVVARVGGLEVRGRAIAAQSGGLGETIVVVNTDSRKRLRGRVVAAAQVEVRHGW